MKAFERRMAVTDLEFRDGDAGVTLTGYASTFSEPYDMGWYSETVDPEAFSRTLGRKPDVRLLVNHAGLPLARTTVAGPVGRLTLDTDKRGLMVTASLDPADPDVASLVPKMRSGVLNQMSFGFRTITDAWDDDMSKRTLRELDLNDGDVSVVTYPANPNTQAAVRGLGSNVDAIRSAIATLETRAASDEDVVSVLTRALGYFTAIDLIVDNAQDELAEALSIPNPDDDDDSMMSSDPMMSEPDDAGRAKKRGAAEARQRLLTLIG